MWGTCSQDYGLGHVLSLPDWGYLPGKWVGLFWTYSSSAIEHLPGSGTILCPENTVGNNHIRPLASVLVGCARWELVPSPTLKFWDLENEHQALLVIVVTMK